MKNNIKDFFSDYKVDLKEKIHLQSEVTEKTVLQHGDPDLRNLLDKILDEIVLDSSEFRGKENLELFLKAVNSGKKGLILAEHYSNFDYPILLNLMKKSGDAGAELEKRCIAIAGMKLNQDNPYVAACAAGYDRIYIYPSRTLKAIEDPEEQMREIKRSKGINLASMRALENAKKNGKVIVVYPSGTRYRPGKPETKKGVKEIASYIKMSDVMLLVSVNGNCLRISDSGNMQEDEICKDRIILTASPIINCAEFRSEVNEQNKDLDTKAKKQAVVDRVMEILDEMHEKNEVGRL